MATWNFEKLKTTKSVAIKSDLLCLARTPNSEQLWIGSSDFKIYSLDLSAEKPQPVVLEGHTSYVSGVVLAGKTLISGSWDRKLIWWDVEKRQSIRTLDAHQRWIRRVVLSPDQSLVASISDDMTCKLWEVSSGKMLRELNGHELRLPQFDYGSQLYACTFSPDGKFLAVSDQLCQVIVWEVATGKEAARIDAKQFYRLDLNDNNFPVGDLRGLVFTPDGESLALGGARQPDGSDKKAPAVGMVQVYDWKAGKLTYELKGPTQPGHGNPFETLWFHPSSEWLLAFPALARQGSASTLISIFDLKEKRSAKDISSPIPNFGLVASEKADVLYTVGRGTVSKWEFTA